MTKQITSTAVPRLRLAEFRNDQDWASWNLGELVKFFSGGTPSKTEPSYWDGDIPWISASSMYEANIVDSDLKVTPQAIGNGTRLASKGSLLILVRGSMLFNRVPMGIAVVDVAFNQDIKALKVGKGINARFLLNQLIAISPRIPINETGIGAGKIETDTLVKLPIFLPSKIEQQKIADCLTSLDEVIAAQGQKVEALKTHKRGMLQQLFPREGETRPRLRFPEFRNAPVWQRLPLGDIAEIKLGKMLDANKHTSGRLLPYVNNISLRWNEVDTSDLPQMYFKESELERYGLQDGDVLVCEGGEPGRSAVWDGRLPQLKFQKAIHRVRFHVPFVPKIFVLYLEAIAGTTAFESLVTGGGIKHLTGETFAKLTIPVMSLLEQQRIADCLSSLDAQITAESGKLTVFKTHKQGLMQQLFPAPEAASA